MHPSWSPILRFLLAIHILSGIVGLVCAPVAMIAAKGGRTHRRWGKIYFVAMASVALTALMLSIFLPILFLGLVAIFSFYAAFQAYRVLSLKHLYKGNDKAKAIDWVAASLTFGCSLALAIAGIVAPRLMAVGIIGIAGYEVSIVSVIFGIIGMTSAYSAFRTFTRPPTEKMFWWYEHLQGMLASYIAALTAFSAVNLGRWFGAAWWVWLWPTIVGVPAITVWMTYYKKKFAPRAQAESMGKFVA